MMKCALTTLFAALLLSTASALQVIVWDRDLQTKLGYGEMVGGKLNLQLVSDYNGPVVALFARDSSEKALYIGLQSRYDGTLKGAQLSLNVPDVPAPVPLTKFLSSFKLGLNLQAASDSVSLPGLKAAPTPPK